MIFRFAIALAIGLAVGAWTAHSSIRADIGIGSLSVGPWTAWPLEGSLEADPYTKAKVAAEGAVPLGVGEGVEFEATTDSSGRPLDAACDYKVLGRTPKARIWTLTAHRAAPDGADGPAMLRPDDAVAALTSRDLVRGEDGSFAVALGPTPSPGNWIALPRPGAGSTRPEAGSGGVPFRIALRFYDSPVSTSAELFEPTMPLIERRGCRR